jgi:CubicO group peptidase (beta-lactamase class C family)
MNALALLFAMATAATPNLVGLWAAHQGTDPALGGSLEITRGGNTWRADIDGRSAPVTVDGKRVSFALPNDEGAFRGARDGERIAGHWIQPPGIMTGRMATPVTLTRVSPTRWRGVVTPVEQHMTFYLSVAANADGTFSAFLRNPERNVGRFFGVQRIALDGDRVKLFGKEDRVVAQGPFDVENDLMSINFPNTGATFDFHRATPADEAAFYPRGKNAPKYVYQKPRQRDDGWAVATLDEVGMSRDRIEAFVDKLNAVPIDSIHASDVHAVLIARHGKLVLEEYFHGTNPDEPHDTRSAAKSLMSILVNVAKVPASTPVYEAMNYPTSDPRKKAMTLKHLLTMSSGLDCDDNDDNSPGREDTIAEQKEQPDWYLYTLALKNIREPGEKSVYCSCQANLAGGVVGRKSGQWLPDLFRQRVAEPMQIRHYAMNLTPTGDAYMGGGVRFPTREFMKLAQLMLDGGRWHGRQIVSEAWAKESTSPQTTIGDRKYGYLWWLADYPYNGRTISAFFAAGNGGQIVMGVPELDLVIAFYGGNFNERAALIPQNVYVPQDILPAVK